MPPSTSSQLQLSLPLSFDFSHNSTLDNRFQIVSFADSEHAIAIDDDKECARGSKLCRDSTAPLHFCVA